MQPHGEISSGRTRAGSIQTPKNCEMTLFKYFHEKESILDGESVLVCYLGIHYFKRIKTQDLQLSMIQLFLSLKNQIHNFFDLTSTIIDLC